MTDNRAIVDLIEQTIDRIPFCTVCGARTTVAAEADEIAVVCSAADQPVGLLARLSAWLLPHEYYAITS